MRRLTIQAFALFACILAVTASPVAVQNVSAKMKAHTDGPGYSSEWSDSKYKQDGDAYQDLEQLDYNGSETPVRLQSHTDSGAETGFGDYESGDSDLTADSTDITLDNGFSEGREGQRGVVVSGHSNPPVGSVVHEGMGRAYHLYDNEDIVQTDHRGLNEDQIACGFSRETQTYFARGIADGQGYSGNQLTVMYTETSFSNSRFDLFKIDTSDCSITKVTEYQNSGGTTDLWHGLETPVEGDSSDRLVISEAGLYTNIERLDVDSGSRTTVASYEEEGSTPRSLNAYKLPDGTVWYVIGYDDGNVGIYEKSASQGAGPVKLFNPGENMDAGYLNTLDDGQFKWWLVGASSNQMHGVVPENLWSGDRSGKVLYQNELSGESGISSEKLQTITWSGAAPSAYKGTGGSLELQVKDSSDAWRTVDTVSSGSGSFTNNVDLPDRFHGVDKLEYRVYVTDYGIRGSAEKPQVTSVEWTHEWYSTGGVIESTRLDTRDVKSFKTVGLSGTAGGQGVSVEILDKHGNVEFSKSGVQPDSTVDISSTPVDDSTEYIYVRLTLKSNGASTPEVTGWELNYDGNPTAKVESYAAEVTQNTTLVTNESSVTSEIGSTDTFTINETNQSIEEITWQVGGETVKTESVSGTGPFSLDYTWGNAETGVNSVTAELSNRNGTTTHTWDVEIPSPSTVKYGTIDIIKGETRSGADAQTNVTVDFPGDSQTITTDIGTQFDVVVETSNENVTYDLTMTVSDPVGTSVTVEGVTGDYVSSSLSDSLPVDKARNFDGGYGLTLSIDVTNNELSTFDVRGVYKQQIADAQSTPDVQNVKVPSAVHRGDAFNVSATVSSDITSVRQVSVQVENPDGVTDKRHLIGYENTPENESVTYDEQLTFNKTGQYEVTVVGQNYDRLNGTSRTYVVDVQNAPPDGQLRDPPTQLDANRSFRLFWDVSDPEGDAITETGIQLTSPSGTKLNFTDDVAGSGEHSLAVGPGNVTEPGLWAIQTWQRDDKGGLSYSAREIVEVTSLQEYTIRDATVGLWNGTTFDTNETPTLHAGRAVELNAAITPNVSNTLNGTVYANLETESGALVSELYTATSVTLTNGTTVSLADINNGTVTSRIPASATGSYVIEVGVVSDEGESTYRIPVDVRGVTSGDIQSLSVNKEEVYPPEFLTVTSTVLNDGEQDTHYNMTVQVAKNGTTHLAESVNTTDIRSGDTASAGVGFQIPEDLPPGAYTLEVSLASPNHSEWDDFDQTSVPFSVKRTRQAAIDTVDLTYESGVIQGAVTVENDGNVPLGDGSLRVIVEDAATENRVAVEDIDVQSVPVGTVRQKALNFNFSADRNSTYYVQLRYDEGNVSDEAYTQVATAPQPSMQIVDVDGPDELVQGQNATYTITVNNNGDVRVNSTSLLVQLQTGQGDTVLTRGVAVDATYPGKTQTVEVTVPIEDASLLGRSAVSVVGQAHRGNNTTLMLPREESVFVSAPGFIISGDSAFSDLSVGESFTVTETFLVVGRPDAAITVQATYDDERLNLVSGEANQTITSGASVSWTFVVEKPIGDKAIQIVAQSGDQRKAKLVSVATVGSTGLIGNMGDGLTNIDGYEDVWTNTYTAAVLPGFDYGVYALLQWLIAISLVAVVQFHNATQTLTPLQKHGGSVVVAGWTSGVMPVVMVLVSVAYGVLVYVEKKYGFS